jgi:hypothetical protein
MKAKFRMFKSWQSLISTGCIPQRHLGNLNNFHLLASLFCFIIYFLNLITISEARTFGCTINIPLDQTQKPQSLSSTTKITFESGMYLQGVLDILQDGVVSHTQVFNDLDMLEEDFQQDALDSHSSPSAPEDNDAVHGRVSI